MAASTTNANLTIQSTQPANRRHARANKDIRDPWGRTLVLSLDGGGVRGISSLRILKRVMRRVAEEDKEHCRDVDAHGQPIPARPCQYFDLIVGTSTGGLIAIMLGRFRMTVDDAIREYHHFADRVFVNPKPLHQIRTKYNEKSLEKAVKSVIRRQVAKEKGTDERGQNTWGEDYAEEPLCQLDSNQALERSCLTALVSVKEGKGEVSDTTYLFRSYDFSWRRDENITEVREGINYEEAFSGPIWQACRATTAAPTYFKSIEVNGSRYMDGGTKHNNPSRVAWGEAEEISEADYPRVGLLLSIGTGRSKERSRFGQSGFLADRRAMLGFMRSNVTDTDQTHEHLDGKVKAMKCSEKLYARLTVKHGLGDVGLDEWKKKRKPRTGARRTNQQNQPINGSVSERSPNPEIRLSDAGEGGEPQLISTNSSPSQEKGQPDGIFYKVLKPFRSRQSTQELFNVHPHGLDPKYEYETLDKIYEKTEKYLNKKRRDKEGDPIESEILRIADRLIAFARARRKENEARWNSFVQGGQSSEVEELNRPFSRQEH